MAINRASTNTDRTLRRSRVLLCLAELKTPVNLGVAITSDSE